LRPSRRGGSCAITLLCTHFRHRGTIVHSIAFSLLATALVVGCADKQVIIRYQPDATLERLIAPKALTIFDFSDERGTEGDHDIFRVGGIYVGVWTRLVKVMTDTPWPRALSRALASGFAARGVPATIAYRAFVPGSTPFATPFALTGQIKNFSTEFRFATSAHISGVVQLHDSGGAVLVEKRISERRTWGVGTDPVMSEESLQDTLNRALAGFVSKVVNDPEVISLLTGR
jgi:hypothetical protein